MKSPFLLSLIVALLISGSAIFAHADEKDETSNTSDTNTRGIMIGDETRQRFPTRPKPGTNEDTQDKRAEFKENFEAKRAEFKTRFDEFRKDKINRLIEMMKQRFFAAIERLRGIADRIEARIAKIEEETGKDLSEASNHVKEAREHLNNAETALGNIATTTGSLFTDEATTSEHFGGLRKLFAEAKAEIKAARESLGLALRLIGFIKGPSERPEIPINN